MGSGSGIICYIFEAKKQGKIESTGNFVLIKSVDILWIFKQKQCLLEQSTYEFLLCMAHSLWNILPCAGSQSRCGYFEMKVTAIHLLAHRNHVQTELAMRKKYTFYF